MSLTVRFRVLVTPMQENNPWSREIQSALLNSHVVRQASMYCHSLNSPLINALRIGCAQCRFSIFVSQNAAVLSHYSWSTWVKYLSSHASMRLDTAEVHRMLVSPNQWQQMSISFAPRCLTRLCPQSHTNKLPTNVLLVLRKWCRCFACINEGLLSEVYPNICAVSHSQARDYVSQRIIPNKYVNP